ncbi:MAG: NUDIX hydrolase [Pseudomonadota bacterium]
MSDQPQWLVWARELQALAQTSLHYTQSEYDKERYERVREIAVAMMAAGSDAAPNLILDLFARQAGYATPKVDVRAAIIRDGKILMVPELIDGGRWSLPGGWADVNSSPTECVIREVHEETGYVVEVRKLAAVIDRNKHPYLPEPFQAYKLFFLCEIVGGSPRDSIETGQPAFFALDALPELSPARVIPEHIARMFDHHADPSLPTDYD